MGFPGEVTDVAGRQTRHPMPFQRFQLLELVAFPDPRAPMVPPRVFPLGGPNENLRRSADGYGSGDWHLPDSPSACEAARAAEGDRGAAGDVA
jgi:hypothetical protein